MDLKDFLRLAERNRILIAVSTIVGILLSIVLTFLATPQYTAEGQLFVSTPSQALDLSALVQGSSFSEQRVKSYAQIINGPDTLNPVIEELGLSVTADELGKSVKASAPLDSVLINFSVTDPSPQLAADLVDAIGKQFSMTVASLESGKEKATDAIKVTMVKSAVIPEHPTSPKKALNLLLGLILGLGAGLGLSLLRQSFDNTVKNEDDFGDTQLLAAILFDELAAEKPLITQISRYAARTESMRQLRTNLQFGDKENRPQVIGFTSALPGEGKTSICINLGISMAAAGASVLVIEADMRRPKIYRYLGKEDKSAGLADLLDESKNIQSNNSFITPFPEVKKLSILNSGDIPADPSELLQSDRLEEIIATCRKKFDFILIDTPPILPVSDAAIISRVCDGMVVVTHAGQTRRNQFMGVIDALKQVQGNILGVVINMIPMGPESADYGYRYASSYYGRYRGYRGYSNTYGNNEPYGIEKRTDGKDEITLYAPQSEKPYETKTQGGFRAAEAANSLKKVGQKIAQAATKFKK